MQHFCALLLVVSANILLSSSFLRGGPRERSLILKRLGASHESISVGIDLGTTNSAVSLIENGQPVIVPVAGNRLLPSVVAFGGEKNSNPIVGKDAKNLRFVNPRNTFLSVKRVIGRNLEDLKNVRADLTYLKVDKSSESPDGLCRLKLDDGTCKDPEDVSAVIVRSLVRAAEEYSGKRVLKAVIGVPAYFTPDQCAATERAGSKAGLHRVVVIKEPEAAALAYGLTSAVPQLIMVFDIGGGTLDVSILDVGNGFVEVISTGGDAHLGGDDIDKRIVKWLLAQYQAAAGDLRSPTEDPQALHRLFEAAEAAKIALSSCDEAVISLPQLYRGIGIECTLTRSVMERLVRDLIPRILRPIREACILAGVDLPGESGNSLLSAEDPRGSSRGRKEDPPLLRRKQAALDKEVRRLKSQLKGEKINMFPAGKRLDKIILVGGCTKIPFIQRLLKGVTAVKPVWSVNPDEAVCIGAGIYAGMLDGVLPNMVVLSPFQASLMRFLQQHKDLFPQNGEELERPEEKREDS
jgi:heat shock protein 1/8